MEVRETGIKGLVEIIPTIFSDNRGWFMESYNRDRFKDLNLDLDFVQDNLSFSKAGVIRGLHFQSDPHQQGKLVKVIQGKVLDVAVDIRPNSATFGKHDTVLLTAKDQNMFYLPEGFAHGFLAIEDSYLLYKCTKTYQRDYDTGISYNDPDLGIDWKVDSPIISEKDQNLLSFEAYKDSLGL